MIGRKVSILAVLLSPIAIHAQSNSSDTSLNEVIDLVRSQGIQVSYSTRLVQDWMRVEKPSADGDFVALLRDALAQYELELSEGREGRYLIVKSAAARRGHERERPPLPPAPTIDEISVTASQHTMFDRRGVPGQTLDSDDIKLLPHIGDDVLRAMHRLPGVASSDFQAPFNLRGGYFGETGVILDGVQINDPYHMRSLFRPLSLIDPGIIGAARLQSGGMTAETGNFLSGVVNISSARTETDSTHEVGVSSITAFARTRGWFANGRGDYLISVRRGWLDLVADEVVGDDEVLSPRYADAFFRASYEISPNTEVSVHALWSDDNVEYVDSQDGEERFETGGSNYVWFNVDSEPLERLRLRATVFAGQDETIDSGSQFLEQEEAIARELDHAAEYIGANGAATLNLSAKHMLRFGLSYREISSTYDYQLNAWRRTDFVNGGSPFVVNRDIEHEADTTESSFYAAYRFVPVADLVVETGLRWDHQENKGFRSDSQYSPRLNVLVPTGDRTELRASWGVFYQPHLATQLDVVDGSIAQYRPEKAEQAVLGVTHRFRSGVELIGDAYDKRYSRLRPRYENVVDTYEFAAESNFDRVRINPTDGRAYGVELGLRSRQEEGLGWWVNYSWSKTYDVVDGREVPRAWDQRHQTSANLSWTGPVWSASVVARYHSGWPRTNVSAMPVFDNSGNIIGADADISERNSDRYDGYTRVDVRLARRIDLSKGQLSLYVEMFNVLNADNPCCTSNHTLNIGTGVSLSPEIDDSLPRFPSFGFVWTFGPGSY